MDLGLEGKVAIVTGASRGIGAKTAEALAREGCSVALMARSVDQMNEIVAGLKAAGHSAAAFPCDLRDKELLKAAMGEIVSTYKRVDLVVANAGAARYGDILELTDEDWEHGFSLKFYGHLRLVRMAWPLLKASRGSIIFVCGGAGRTSPINGSISGVVNSALMNFTKALADRGLGDHVRVNAVNPGAIRTDRLRTRVGNEMRATGLDEDTVLQNTVNRSRIMRIGEPEDVAATVAFVASDRGSYLHGTIIDVDGGLQKSL